MGFDWHIDRDGRSFLICSGARLLQVAFIKCSLLASGRTKLPSRPLEIDRGTGRLRDADLVPMDEERFRAPSALPWIQIARPVIRDSGLDSRGQKLEITVSLARLGSSMSSRRKCIVRIRHPQKSPLHAEPSAENSADGEVRRYNEPDHKLPFWAR